MFLFADHLAHPGVAIVGKGFGGMFEQTGLLGRLRWRHRWRQVDQPFGIGGKAAHDLQRRRAILLADGDRVVQPSADDALAQQVAEVKQIIMLLLGAQGGLRRRRQEGACRLGISVSGGDGDQFPLWIAQHSEPPTKDTAGVDVDRAVEPFGFGHRRMPIDDHCLAAVFGCPVIAHGQPKLVGLAGCLAIEGKVTHLARTAPLHRLFHAGMGHHQFALIQHIVAHQPVEKSRNLVTKRGRLLLQLRQRISQPVRDLHRLATQLAHQFQVVISRHTERCPCRDHPHHQAQDGRDLRPAINQVAEEDRLAPSRRLHRVTVSGRGDLIA